MIQIKIESLMNYKMFKENKDYIINKIQFLNNVFCICESIDIDIQVFTCHEQLTQYIEQNIPQWVVGVSCFPNQILLIVNKETDYSIINIFIHEYVHLLVKQKSKCTCPQWLNEGLSLYFAEQINKKDFDNIEIYYNYYNSSWANEKFYLQCAYIMNLIIEKYGETKTVYYIINCTNFEEDKLLGINALKKLEKEEIYERSIKKH